MTRLKFVMVTAALTLSLAGVSIHTAPAFAEAEANTKQARPSPFQPTEDVMADVNAMLARASTTGKLGLIIMGGNWCHDSRALARRMATAKLAPVLDTNYETLLVDVAGLSDNMDVAKRFGRPVIYGTPTVLIINPATEKLVNAHDMHQWRDAERISVADTTDYFTRMATAETRGTPADMMGKPRYTELMADIDAFENTQAKRIYQAFAVIGPMLEIPKSQRPENFIKLWIELSQFRYQITKDLAALEAKARAFAAAGDASTPLSYPNYKPFSWE